VTGGGSGGHITPILAVADELKALQPDIEIIYVGQTGDGLGDVPAQHRTIDSVKTVRAGKLRRYHGEGWRQLLDLKTMLLNLRDMVLVVVGFWQSFWLLKRLKPNAVFIKGGFVGVPVGLSAALLRIPYVTHDSDALPGLANRIVAPWAKKHAVALPKEVYSYPTDKTEVVGVPIAREYRPLTDEEIRGARKRAGVPLDGRVLFITGGGLGALRLNNAVAACVPDLLMRYRDLTIVQLSGRAHEAELRRQYTALLPPADQSRVIVKGYVTNLYLYSGAADVIITRAGATAIAEFAAQEKPCVVVPNPLLSGGHQLKNARVLTERKAIRMVPEDALKADPLSLMAPVVELLDKPEQRRLLGKKLATFVQTDAAERLAMLLLDVAKR
jgi:UDP-N-acetylglucosamine--N-acetylmuramyl-(pentapeptide) pyrophosphoryl-undecaprenol N-acetylglucosamine transferase